MGALFYPTLPLLYHSARQCTITNQATGQMWRWEPNDYQKIFWKIADDDDRHRYAVKCRQQGLSTSELLRDTLFVGGNAVRETPVDVFLIWHKDEEAQAKLSVCEDFARQLGIKCKRSGNHLYFPVKGHHRQGTISAITAGGKRAGAANTAHHIHFSENPAYRDAGETFLSAMSTLVGAGTACIETTMLIVQEQPKALWDKSTSEWVKVFFGVEDHKLYRRPAEEFREYHPDVPGRLLREWGMTNVESMAFMQKIFEEKCGGDIYKLGREYPPSPEVAFQSAKGRWVHITPDVCAYESRPVPEADVSCRIFVPPDELWETDQAVLSHAAYTWPDCGDRIIIGVDTAGCRPGSDRSAVAVMDRRDGRLLASYRDDEATVEQLALVVRHLAQRYTAPTAVNPWTRKEMGGQYPLVIVEVNGIGQTTAQRLEHHGVTHRRYNAKAGDTHGMMLAAKRSVESGATFGSEWLAEECDSVSYVDTKWHGRKDLLVSVGICAKEIERSPWIPPPPAKRRDVVEDHRPRRRRGI
jgi:hypothetical protein